MENWKINFTDSPHMHASEFGCNQNSAYSCCRRDFYRRNMIQFFSYQEVKNPKSLLLSGVTRELVRL